MEKRANNNYVVSIINGTANIKKVRRSEEQYRIELISESTEAYPPILLHDTDQYLIVGEVKQVISKSTNY